MIYLVAIALLTIVCLVTYKTHPEVQFAFVMPGCFIIMYSIVRDDIYKRSKISLMRSGFRER